MLTTNRCIFNISKAKDNLIGNGGCGGFYLEAKKKGA
jgi:hypothetical protein